MIRLLPLTWNEIDTWPLNLTETLAQAIQKMPDEKTMFLYLIEELENPNALSTASLDQLRKIYSWIGTHLK